MSSPQGLPLQQGLLRGHPAVPGEHPAGVEGQQRLRGGGVRAEELGCVQAWLQQVQIVQHRSRGVNV